MQKLIKTTILSISVLTVMSAAAVASVLAEIAQAFPWVSADLVKMVLTVPCLLIILGSLVSGRLVSVMEKRKVLVIGLVLYLIGGLGAGLVDSFVWLLVLRGILGIGVGLIMPLSISLIAEYFSGAERAHTMGLSTAASSLGGIIANVLAGLLAVISWRLSFCVYSLGFIVLFLVLFFLPQPTGEASISGHSKAQPLPLSVYYIGLLTFGILVVFFSIPTSLALFIQNQHLGYANTVGLALGLTNVFIFLAGVEFQTVYARLKSYIVPCGLSLLAAGFTMLSISHSIYLVLAALALFGLGFGTLMPLVYLQTTTLVSEDMRPRATALVTSFFYLGQFASPLLLGIVGKISGDYSIRMIFTVLAYLLLAALLMSLAVVIKKHRSSDSTSISSVYEEDYQ